MYKIRPLAGVPIGDGWDQTYRNYEAAEIAADESGMECRVVDAETLETVDPRRDIFHDLL